MPRVLVTGGMGFIGSNLALELQSQGFEVLIVDRNLSTAQNLTGFRGRHLEQDVSHSLHVDGPLDVIFHQAAITDPRYHNDEEILRSNIEGFHVVLQLALKKGARLVYASTAGLYGNGPTPMREDQRKECLTAYGRSKLAMDEIAETYFDKLPLVGLRYFNVFGPREGHKGRPSSMIYHLSRQMRAGQRPRVFFQGEHRRDHVYVKDVVQANLCALSAPSGIYNVGTGIGTSFNELISHLNEAMGLHLEPDYFPMPFDPGTYQLHTVADTRLAEERLRFKAAWPLPAAIRDYLRWLEK